MAYFRIMYVQMNMNENVKRRNAEKNSLLDNFRSVSSLIASRDREPSPIVKLGLMTAGDTRFFQSQRKGRCSVVKETKS